MTPVPAPTTRHAIGVMTGTSIDGIDASLVRIEGQGLDLRATLLKQVSEPFGDLATALREAAEQKPMAAGAFARLALDFGTLHAEVIGRLVEQRAIDLDLICVHGQTVFHQPPVSWQLINTAPIAQRFGCPVIGDLRQADLAAGGQGAPITPITDWIMFRHHQHRRAIANLGGFCNVTVLPPASVDRPLEAIEGFDVCPCNQVLDAVARIALNAPMDRDGATAQSGAADPEAVNTLLAWIRRRREATSARRSMGTGDEAAEWVHHHAPRLSARDLAASAANAIGGCIATALTARRADEIILAGGGVHNRALVQAIRSIAKAPVTLSDDHGVPAAARESMAFAVLGALCLDGVPITLPQVTGCAAPAPLAGLRSSST